MEEIARLLEELENTDNKSEIYYEIALIYYNKGMLKSSLVNLAESLLWDREGVMVQNIADLMKAIKDYIRDDYKMTVPQNIDRSVSFKDVGGLKQIKHEIDMKIIKPFLNPDIYKKFKKKTGGGVLLYGPPGCGKTFLAKATAGECKAEFISVSISDILDPYIGKSERNIRDIFEQARAKKPCVLFFDEIDSLGYKRSRLHSEHLRTVIDEFLSQLQGFSSDNDGVLIIGATNMPWDVDEAFKRPGRFDKMLFVTPPDTEARKEIFKLKTAGIFCSDINFDLLAERTPLYSGADIQNVVETASEYVISEIFDTGKEREIMMTDFLKAIENSQATTTEWITTIKNFIRFSDKQEYSDAKRYIKENKL